MKLPYLCLKKSRLESFICSAHSLIHRPVNGKYIPLLVGSCRTATAEVLANEQFLAPDWLKQLLAGMEWRLKVLRGLHFMSSCLDIFASILVFQGLRQRLTAIPFFFLVVHQVRMEILLLRIHPQ